MTTPLTKKQKAIICITAAKAYEAFPDAYGDMSLEAFRREETWAATQKTSLTECTQEDYVPIINRFRAILGVRLLPDRTRSSRAQAAYILEASLRKHELSTAYLSAIARDKFGPRLAGYSDHDIIDAIRAKLSRPEIMQLVYTINNRGAQKTKKLAKLHGID